MKLRVITSDNPNYPWEALHVFAENSLVNDHNNMMLERLQTQPVKLVAIDKFPSHVPSSVMDKTLSQSYCQTGGLHKELIVKEGARVMLTTNLCIMDCLISGQIGTVKRIYFENLSPRRIYIKFDDPKAGSNLISESHDRFARDHNLVPIEQIEAAVKVSKCSSTSPCIKRIQFPLTLSWAYTIHKVQSLTVEKLVVSFTLLNQRSFSYGQLYVALGRVTKLPGLSLVPSICYK